MQRVKAFTRCQPNEAPRKKITLVVVIDADVKIDQERNRGASPLNRSKCYGVITRTRDDVMFMSNRLQTYCSAGLLLEKGQSLASWKSKLRGKCPNLLPKAAIRPCLMLSLRDH